MVNSIWEDIKRQFQSGDTLTRIILVNLGVFLSVNLLLLIFFFIYQQDAENQLNKVLTWFEAGSTLRHNLTRPWTIITYMFLHKGFWHFLWNMLILYWFGRILQELSGNQRILPVYVLGGIAGFVAYVIAAQFFPSFISPYMLGASAGVAAVIMASAVLAPEYRMNLILIGPVPLKYLAAFFILMFLFSIPRGNTGGHFAHLGGVLMGWFFVHQLRNGNDMSVKFNSIVDGIKDYLAWVGGIFQSKKGPRVAYKNPKANKFSKGGHKRDDESVVQQEKVDEILEKIKRSGYESLTEEEKDFLFKASKEK